MLSGIYTKRHLQLCHKLAVYVECRYPECRYAECSGAHYITQTMRYLELKMKNDRKMFASSIQN